MSRFIATTTLSAMRSTGSAAERSLARLGAIMAKEFPQGTGFELAEPVPRQDGSGIDWYTDREEKLASLADLSPETAILYRSRLDQSVQTVRAAAAALESRGDAVGRTTAAALRGAVTFPGEGNVWIAGPSADGGGTIILTAWGYETHDTIERGKIGEIVGSARERLPPGVRDKAGSDSPSPEGRPGWRPTALALLWLVPLVLAGATGWLLLPACGLRLPVGGIVFGTGAGAFCALEQPVQIVDQDRVRTRELMAEVAVLQEQARRHMNSCRPEHDVVQEAENRVDRAGGTTDNTTMQVSLVWNNRADLDLHVICPDGNPIPLGGERCGGKHEIDMNLTRYSDEPVEHVIWRQDPPPGRYKIRINFYDRRGVTDPQVNFTVIVKKNGETTTYPGGISTLKQPTTIAEFEVP